MNTIPLWPAEAIPYTLGSEPRDTPTLTFFTPFGTRFSDCAVMILPGGGYRHHAVHEGEGYAGFFRHWGFKTFVCNYRLGSAGYRHPVMLADAARALRLVRANAEQYQIDPEKIVLVGSSAGGHLAATLMTKWAPGLPDHDDPVERVSSRPSLAVLCYPVVSMIRSIHIGSRNNLLGENPTEEAMAELSAELHVNADTPPCFLWHTVEDSAVSVENALMFANALHRASVPFEFHCYEAGKHGLGMKDGIPWTEDCIRWLQRRL